MRAVPTEERGSETGREPRPGRPSRPTNGGHEPVLTNRTFKAPFEFETRGGPHMPEEFEPVRVNDETFELEVLRSSLPVVVDFYADWCAPCVLTEPVLRELSERLAGRVKFAKVNVDEATFVTRSYGIHSIPTYVFVRAGHERGREVGPVDPVAFRSILRRHFAGRDDAASGGRRATR
jgi:thioredoxin